MSFHSAIGLVLPNVFQLKAQWPFSQGPMLMSPARTLLLARSLQKLITNQVLNLNLLSDRF